MSLIQKYIFEKKRLYVVFVVYVVFVDLMKCYDTNNHNTLWFKLFKMGVRGKFLRIVKYMYRKVKACVKSLNSFFLIISSVRLVCVKERLCHLLCFHF